MDILNLDIHDIEDIPGKLVNINGVQYIFEDLFAEGGESLVYPLKNAVSGLVFFLGKIYKFRPGSEEYEEKKTKASQAMFHLQAIGITALHAEYYEIPGALMGFQKLLGSVDEIEYHRELMTTANSLAEGKEYIEALRAYDNVLKANPNHTHAIANKAICLLNLEQIPEALELLFEAIRIEPNEISTYHTAANVFVSVGKPESAIGVLEETLHRWKIDFPSWNLLMEIALKNDLTDTATEWLKEATNWAPETESVRKFYEELEKSRLRHQEYDTALGQAISLQMESRWQEALDACEQAVKASNNNHLALLNRNICKYHLGIEGIAEETSSLLYVFEGVPQFSCIALAILAYSREDNYEMVKRLALFLNSIIEHPMDLPRIPVAVTYEFAQEVQKVTALTTTIKLTHNKLLLSSDEAKEIQELLNRYGQLEPEALL